MNLFDKVTGMRRLFRGLCNVVLLGALMMVVANVMGQPAKPTGVMATITGTNAATNMHEFSVTWDAGSGTEVAGWEVGRVVGPSLASVTGNDIEFASYGAANSNPFVQEIAATPNKRFVHLAVRAVDDDGMKSEWEEIAKPLRMAAPDAVDLMTPTVNGNEVTLNWNSPDMSNKYSSGITKFVPVCTNLIDSNDSWGGKDDQVKNDEDTATTDKLMMGASYRCRVRSENGIGTSFSEELVSLNTVSAMGETATSVYVEFDKDSSESDSDPQYRVSWGMDMSMEVSGVTSEEDTDTRQGLILEGLEPGTMYTIGVERKIGDDMWGSKAEATATTLSKAYSSGSDSNQYYDIARGETIELDLSDLMVLAISSPGAMDDWDKNRGMAGSPVSATLTVSSSSSSVTAERTPDAVYSTSEKLSITGVKAGTGTVTVTAKFSDSGYDDVVARLPVKVTDDLMPRFTADVVELTWNVDMNADGSGTDLEIDLTSYLNEASVEELNADCSDEDENADNTVNCDQEFTYSIAVDGPGNYFEVDEETGMITVDSPSLDPLEHGDVFQITATVTDVNGHKDTMEFDITVSEDTNDLPMKRPLVKPLTLNPMSQSAIENGTGTRTRTATFSRYFSDRETNSRDLCYKIEGGSGSGKTATATTTGDATGKKIADATLNRVTGRKDSSCHGDELTITMRLPSNNPMDEDSALLGEYAAYDATFEVKACEPTNKTQCTDTVEVSVKVVYGTNSAPTLRAIAYADGTPYSASGGFTVAENTRFSLTFTADDAQGHDEICISRGTRCSACKGSGLTLATSAAGGFSHEKTITQTLGLDYESTNGAYTLNVCASDLSGETDTLAFNIKVTDVAEAPKITSITEGGSSASHIYMLVDDDPRVLTINARDGDGDDLTYHAECVGSNCSGGVGVSVNGNVLTIRAPSSALANDKETYEIEVMVTDSTDRSATRSFMVSVKNENQDPYFVSGLSGIALSTPENTSGTLPVNLEVTDPDGDDELKMVNVMGTSAFRASVRNQGSRKVVQISVARSSNLNYEADASPSTSDANFFSFTIEIMDPYGGTDYIDVDVEITDVNEKPYRMGSIADQMILEGVEVCAIDASTYFADPDERDIDRGLDFEVKSTRSSDASVRIKNRDIICVKGIRPGSGRSTVSVTATDHGGYSVSDTFYLVVAENPPPTVIGTGLADQTIQVNGRADWNLMDYFSNGNPDFAENMTFEADVSDPSKATCVLIGADEDQLRCYGDARGSTDITITATDQNDQSVESMFMLTVMENDPPMVVGELDDVVRYLGRDYDLIDATDVFEDEGDTLEYSIKTSDSEVAVAAIKLDASGGPWIDLVLRTAGTTRVTVTAEDTAGSEAETDFVLMVRPQNDPPTVENPIADVTIESGGVHNVSLEGVFSDDDDLAIEVSDDYDEDVADVIYRASNNEIRIYANDVGETEVEVTATETNSMYDDYEPQSVSDTFTVTVVAASSTNAAPVLSGMFEDQTLTVGEPMTLSIAGVFTDPDGDVLTYTATVGNTEIATAGLTDEDLLMTGLRAGTTFFTITASDGELEAVGSFDVIVDTVPMAVGQIPNQILQIGGDASSLNVGEYFADEDGDVLSYTVSTTGNAATISNIGASLSMTPFTRGDTQVTITASDPKGRSATQTFSIEVSDSALKSVATDALAGQARTFIGSVSEALTGRFESNRAESEGMTFGFGGLSHFLPDSSAEYATNQDLMRFDTGNAQASLDADWSNVQTEGQSVEFSLPNVDNMMQQGFSHSLSGTGIGSWSTWGTSDAQSFAGEGYEGESRSTFLGLDVQYNEALTLGVTVSRNKAESDYSWGTASQSMNSSMITVFPYINYEPTNGKSSVWGTFGRGFGDAETSVVNADSQSSDLSLNLGMVGGRHELAQTGNLKLALRGDYAFASLSTADGEGAIDALTADVSRIRAGLEGSLSFNVGNSRKLTPFGEVAFRSDGGDGLTGEGIEVAGGIRLESNALSLEAKGRMTATHSAEDFSEQGFSVAFSLNPSRDESGISVSFTPTWGQSTEMTDSMWTNTSQVGSTTPYGTVFGSTNGMSMTSNLSYGIQLNNEQLMLVPFVDYQSMGTFGKTVMFGTDLKQLTEGARQFGLRAFIGASEGADRTVEPQAGLNAQIRF